MSCSDVVEGLYSGDEIVQEEAMNHLGCVDDETLLNLVKKLEDETNEALIDSLLLEGFKREKFEFIQVMADLISSEIPKVRNRSLELLSQKPEMALPIMPELLRNPDKDVRILSANMMNYMPSEQITPILLSVLEQEEEVNVVAQLLDTLKGVVSEEMLPDLINIKERFVDEPYIGFVTDQLIDLLKNAN